MSREDEPAVCPLSGGVRAARRALATAARPRRASGPQIGDVDGSRHSGGRVSANGVYLVGRPGAEELFVPDQPGMILSGQNTDRLMANWSDWTGTGMARGATTVINNYYSYDERSFDTTATVYAGSTRLGSPRDLVRELESARGGVEER